MLHEIIQAVPHPDHSVTVTWSDGACASISLVPFLERGGLFEALTDPIYFVKEMRILPGGIGLTWPDEVDFSADGLRQAAFPAEATGEVDEPVTGAWESERKQRRQAILFPDGAFRTLHHSRLASASGLLAIGSRRR